MNRNKSKSAELELNKLIIIILCILVLLALLMFIYRTSILEWLRNLPGYNYENDTEIEAPDTIDAAASLACVDNFEIGFLGTPEGTLGFREQYIYFKTAEGSYTRTKFYWDGEKDNAKILLKREGEYSGWDWLAPDLEVAEVKDGIVSVLLGFDSEIYQRTRFSSEKPIELSLIPKLNGTYTAGNNRLCRKTIDASLSPAWPESEGGKLITIEPNLYIDPEEGDLVSPGLEQYFTVEYTQELEFLYLVNKEDYISVYGSQRGWLATDIQDLLRVYPDGSIWIMYSVGMDLDNQIRPMDNLGVKKRINPYILRDDVHGYHSYETNIRMDYNQVRALVEESTGKSFVVASNINKICPVKVARISTSKKIEFCDDNSCGGTINSKLLWVPPSKKYYHWTEAKIYVDQGNDDKIGEIKDSDGLQRNTKIIIDQEVLDGVGDLYFEVKDDLPEEKYLVNLNGAEFKSGYLCRDEKVVVEKVVDTSLDKGYAIENLAKNYLQVKDLLDGKITETKWISIGYGLNNQDNRLGFNTGGDDITKMKLKKVGDNFYIKFSDSDTFFSDESPWVLLKYWDQYRSFSWVPKEYTLN
jgi:hypothetical protein